MDVVLVGAANPQVGKVLAAVRRVDPDYRVVGFIDNDPAKHGQEFVGYPVLGGFELLEELIGSGVYFVNLITGSTRVRYETSKEMADRGCRFTNLIHPGVDLDMVEVGVGVYVLEMADLQAQVVIGDNASVGHGSIVSHETRIGPSAFVSTGCHIAGLVEIGDGAFIGTGATVIPGIRIGRWATVGAGAVVTEDVPDYATVVGSPARVIKVDPPHYADGAISSKKD